MINLDLIGLVEQLCGALFPCIKPYSRLTLTQVGRSVPTIDVCWGNNIKIAKVEAVIAGIKVKSKIISQSRGTI